MCALVTHHLHLLIPHTILEPLPHVKLFWIERASSVVNRSFGFFPVFYELKNNVWETCLVSIHFWNYCTYVKHRFLFLSIPSTQISWTRAPKTLISHYSSRAAVLCHLIYVLLLLQPTIYAGSHSRSSPSSPSPATPTPHYFPLSWLLLIPHFPHFHSFRRYSLRSPPQ